MKVLNVVAAIIHHEGEIFATQRGYGEFKDGWEFPGGKVQENETPEEALKREIQEELDTEISVDAFIGQVECDYPAFHLSMKCYWCAVVAGDLTLKEHEAAKWLSPEELESVDWLPADLQILPLIKKKLASLS
ncbi:MAG: (deoxy)nucleoside triphosphate pyrophosphohydrolase [Clostridia bacterium]|nr:(deoxy)nucleoside triphosphate pyrophosphohydrolase [Clostridia bacterium]